MNATLYLEGGAIGAGSKELKIRCRQGFRKLLENCSFKDRMPQLVACGPRDSAFDRFKTAMEGRATGDYVGLWIDSEDPLKELDSAWKHLWARDAWVRPDGVTDDQVLFMTTCMETLIVADREALKEHYDANLQESALPPLANLENRARDEVQEKLSLATRNCKNAYMKGKRSFAILGRLNPETLRKHLPSFARARRILNQKLEFS